MSKSIRLGPFSELQINQIKKKIDPSGHEYKIELDQDLVEKYQKTIAAKSYYHDKSITPFGEFLYIEVTQESLFIIQKYLHDLGMLLYKNAEYMPDHERFCPKCDYILLQDGYCPEHNLKLIDYSQKVVQKRQKLEIRTTRFFLILCALGFVAFCYYLLFPR